ncbi:DUF4011 domain-containing protein [Solwaraspora sp. WMMB762]|uniref:DUF4011 domain-containing protein n=1 Tax=Solwaraspora sp. WMMB762 TaxID=3404120 RepID=UPI003B964010
MDDRPGNDIVAALGLWRETLVSLTGTNRLINFKQSKTGTVQIVSPTGAEILAGLKNGAVWALLGSQDEEDQAAHTAAGPALPVDATALARVARPDNEVSPVLRNLMRRSNQEYVDRGLSVLYLAIGMLRWQEPDGTAQNSPLLLVPVRLVASGPRQRPLLHIGDDDPVLNPALTLRLQEFGITLPTVDDLADLDLGILLDQVRVAVGERSGWQVTASAVISCFPSIRKRCTAICSTTRIGFWRIRSCAPSPSRIRPGKPVTTISTTSGHRRSTSRPHRRPPRWSSTLTPPSAHASLLLSPAEALSWTVHPAPANPRRSPT